MEQGYKETMAHIASVLRPHGIGLGLSINSVCESRSLAVSSDPTCAPAYRDTPWAAVLTDMGTCESADSAVGFTRKLCASHESCAQTTLSSRGQGSGRSTQGGTTS